LNKNIFIIKKLLNIDFKNFFFISFVNFFTIFCTTLSVTFIILVFSVNNTFKKNIKKNIIKNDGFSTIYKKNNSLINIKEYQDILSTTSDKYLISRLYNKNVIIRNGSKSSVSNMKCVDFFSHESKLNYNKVFNLENTLIKGSLNREGIIIGCDFAEKLNVKVGDTVFIIFKDLTENFTFDVLPKKVSGIFRTYIPDFDNYTSYVDINEVNDVFKLNSQYESLVINFNYDTLDVNLVDYNSVITKNQNLSSEYYKVFWWEKYSYFLNWLNLYDGPINILLFFIMLITIVNVCSSTFIDNTYRCNEILLLNKLGLNNKNIAYIFTFKSIVLTIIGSTLGFLIVQFLSMINSNYGIIEIPSEIYYMSRLPLEVDYLFTFVFIFIIIVMVGLINYITINKFLRNNQVSI